MTGRRRTLTADLLAGLSVALVLIPQSMAYAELAGLPAHRGLYAGALPPLFAAYFASSPYLQTGPTALTSLLSFGSLSAIAVPGTSEYVALAALLALVVGAVRLLIGVARAGNVSYLLSQPVLRGFAAAAALLIIASQVPAVLGVDVAGGTGVLERSWMALSQLGDWNMVAIGLSVVTVLLMLLGPKIHALFPGVLVAVGVGLVYAHVVGYDGATVSEIPTRVLPPISLDLPWSDLPRLIVSGVVIALVGFAEVSSVSQVYAERTRQTWNPDREFVAQGVANTVAGLVGSFPVGGSFSRSSLNFVAGAKTRLAGAFAGGAVLILLPFAGVLSPLPKAILGAVVLAAIYKLLDPRPLVGLYRLSKPQFVIGGLTFALTIAMSPHIEYAVLAGVAMSIGYHIWREQYFDVDQERVGEKLILRASGVIWAGSAPMFRRVLSDAVAKNLDASSIVIDLTSVGRLDLTGALALREVAIVAIESGVSLSFTGVQPNCERIIRRVCGTLGTPPDGETTENDDARQSAAGSKP